MPVPHHPPGVLLIVAGMLATSPAVHADTYSTCAGFIEALPATITTQGTWCLRKDLNTSITSGSAITIAANNVTIDCNSFKIGGLSAGDGSTTRGIHSQSRQNATVRNCSIRGFYYGASLVGGSGHLVEDNLLDQNLAIGIHVPGGDSQVRRNRINDTGGFPGRDHSVGIDADADIIDNTISGVFASAGTTFAYGIIVSGGGNSVIGNVVRGLLPSGTAGDSLGIFSYSEYGTRISDNHVFATTPTPGTGIESYDADTFCTGNTVHNFAYAYRGCSHSSRNLPAY